MSSTDEGVSESRARPDQDDLARSTRRLVLSKLRAVSPTSLELDCGGGFFHHYPWPVGPIGVGSEYVPLLHEAFQRLLAFEGRDSRLSSIGEFEFESFVDFVHSRIH